ncbi:DUF599 domain-containing protein [Maritalea porphyrae]|jgi:uncharacterized membrane protein|uniref:DUF599 domain-containing protein n=1 Tax=Maritalea porphyrae TaxID=880732 RepID=UPI0022AEB471|nr:DUF599 domain-containing protein [Maritalea porphyrae]MCZ4273858.1 DUF599 domain-containing protein [Maritalea porphyrae]
MTLLSTFLPLIFWAFYGLLSKAIETRRTSMSALMARQRLRWVQNAVRRDTPIDGILTGNIMSAVSFFASTSVLLILAMFAVIGQLNELLPTLRSLSWGDVYTDFDYQSHFVVMLVMTVMAFLSFTLSLRHFNHFCILMGAADHSTNADPAEVRAMANLNTQGARHFNSGIRAYYFSIANVGWFLSSTVGIVMAVGTIGFIIYREYFSAARRAISQLPSSTTQIED